MILNFQNQGFDKKILKVLAKKKTEVKDLSYRASIWFCGSIKKHKSVLPHRHEEYVYVLVGIRLVGRRIESIKIVYDSSNLVNFCHKL